jgi:tetratricopeptide (TPR) repeat protein
LIAICSAKLKNVPAHKKALYIRASAYIKKGEYHVSIQDCNKLLESDPDNVGGFYLRGCANDKLGHIDLAIEDFTRVLNLDENHVNAAFARASCLNLKGDFNGAIEDYTRALEKDNAKSLNISNLINKRHSMLRNSQMMSNGKENSEKKHLWDSNNNQSYRYKFNANTIVSNLSSFHPKTQRSCRPRNRISTTHHLIQ